MYGIVNLIYVTCIISWFATVSPCSGIFYQFNIYNKFHPIWFLTLL